MHAYYRYLNDLVVNQRGRHADTVFEPVTIKGIPSIFNDRSVGELSRLLIVAEGVATQHVVQRRVERERSALTAFDNLRRVEKLRLAWGRNRDPQTAARIEKLVEEAMPLLDRLADRFIVDEKAMMRILTGWRDSVRRPS